MLCCSANLVCPAPSLREQFDCLAIALANRVRTAGYDYFNSAGLLLIPGRKLSRAIVYQKNNPLMHIQIFLDDLGYCVNAVVFSKDEEGRPLCIVWNFHNGSADAEIREIQEILDRMGVERKFFR